MGALYDLTGKSLGRLLVVSRAEGASNPKDKNAYWLCKCSCGNPNLIRIKGVALVKGYTNSCGCYQKDMASVANRTHGMTKTRIYHIWQATKRRCYYARDNRYDSYGKRGIKVCDEWRNSFETFHARAVNNRYEQHLSLDRIDADGDYSPANCRWATMKTQQNNRRNNRPLSHNGETHTMAEWEKLKGLPKGLLYSRLNNSKWSLAKALSKPVRTTKRGR